MNIIVYLIFLELKNKIDVMVNAFKEIYAKYDKKKYLIIQSFY